jgi:hypothetical protein
MSQRDCFAIEMLEQRVLLTATLIGPAGTISPDQQWLEYTQSGQTYLENIATKNVATIPSIGAFTGDSEDIIYAANNGGTTTPQLFEYNIATGISKQIPFSDPYASEPGTHNFVQIVTSPNDRYAAFVYSPDGNYIDELHIIELADLQAQTITQIAGTDTLFPAFSPDSQNVAFASVSSPSPAGVFEYNISTGTTTRLSVDNSGNPLPALSSNPDGKDGTDEAVGPIIFSADGKLVAFPLLQRFGNANYIRNLANSSTEDVTDSVFDTGAGGGPVLFSPDDKYLLGTAFAVTATGAEIANIVGIDGFGPTSQQLVVQQSDSSGTNTDLYIVDLTTGDGKQLEASSPIRTLALGANLLIGVTPDRTHAIIQSTSTNLTPDSPTDGSDNYYLISLTPDPDAPDFPKPQPIPGSNILPPGGILSPDGHHVAYIKNNSVHLSDTASNTDIVVPGDGVLEQGSPFSTSFTSDGQALLISTRILFPDSPYATTVRIFRYNLATGQTLSVPYQPQYPGPSDVDSILFNQSGTDASVTIGNPSSGYIVYAVNLITGEPTPRFYFSGLPLNGFSADGDIYLSNPTGVYSLEPGTGTVTLASTDNNGNPLPAGNVLDTTTPYNIVVGSNDGKLLAFSLSPSKSNGIPIQHTYVRNIQTGVVTQYDIPNSGDPANDIPPRTQPIGFSPDDRYLLMESNSTSANFDHIDLVNFSTGAVTLITEAGNPQAIGFGPAGHSVIFDSSVSGLQEIYSYDIASGQTTLVSTSTDGSSPADGNTFSYSVTSDGGAIILTSSATNLTSSAKAVPGATSFVLALSSGTSNSPPTAPTVITDDGDSAVVYAGNWWSSNAGNGFFGGDFRNDGNISKGSSSATFPLKIGSSGTYDVFARWPAITFGTAGSNVPFDVVTANGVVTVTENETQNSGAWVDLGSYSLSASTAAVVIRNAGTNGIVLADAVGTAPSSGTTNNPPPPNPVVVDDTDPRVRFVGNWWSSNAGSGYYGSDFFNDGNQLKGSSSVTFPAPIASSGSYQVFIRYPSITFGTPATNVPVDIITSSGTQTVMVDETRNAGRFISLGTFTLDPATAAVRIRNGGTSGIVLADAVEYVATGSTGGGGGTTTTTTPPQTIVEDDSSRTTYIGNWWSSSVGSGFSGGEFHNDGNQLKGSSSAKFSIPITAAGSYNVYARWPSITFGSVAANVPFDVVTSSGIVTVNEDETQNTGLWVLLGTFNLDPSSAAIVIRNAGTSGIVLADAVGATPA